MTNKPHKICLTVGDWSCDGHEKSDDYYIMSSLSREAMVKAYKKGTKVLGFDYVETVAVEYEDSRIGPEQYKKIKESGYDKGFFNEEYDDVETDGVSISSEEHLDVYLHIVKLGNPSFEYETLTDDASTIEIGGYGLFH